MNQMWRILGTAVAGAAVLLVCGCANGPLLDTATIFPLNAEAPPEHNPIWIPLGPPAYGSVFEKALEVTSGYFEIAYANRYDGRIETFPRIAPGLEQPWKPGSPKFDERLLATLQTYRHRAVVLISSAEDGGYFIDVKVFKELEDLARPIRSTAGAAAFRSDSTVDRIPEVIDAAAFESNWIPKGRDTTVEQAILQKIKKCM